MESRALECEKSKVPLWREQEKETDRKKERDRERKRVRGRETEVG